MCLDIRYEKEFDQVQDVFELQVCFSVLLTFWVVLHAWDRMGLIIVMKTA
jgi:hypothetical protein